MTKKNILIAVLGAIVLGALLGLAIGFVGGFFTSGDVDTQASVTEQKTSVAEEKAKKEEAKKDAEKAAKEAKEDENKAEDKADKADKDTAKDSEPADADKDTVKEDTEVDANAIGTGTVETGGAGLNLRADTDTNSTTNIIGTVQNGDSLTIIGESNGMYQVKTPSGQTGWVSSQYVTMN